MLFLDYFLCETEIIWHVFYINAIGRRIPGSKWVEYITVSVKKRLIINHSFTLRMAWGRESNYCIACTKQIQFCTPRSDILLLLTTFQNKSRNKWYFIWMAWYRAFRIRKGIGCGTILGVATHKKLKKHCNQ